MDHGENRKEGGDDTLVSPLRISSLSVGSPLPARSDLDRPSLGQAADAAASDSAECAHPCVAKFAAGHVEA